MGRRGSHWIQQIIRRPSFLPHATEASHEHHCISYHMYNPLSSVSKASGNNGSNSIHDFTCEIMSDFSGHYRSLEMDGWADEMS